MQRLAALLVLAICPAPVAAGEILVAVASNFDAPMARLAQSFAEHSGHTVRRSAGSTGKLYAQIVNGAPYDLFFAADTLRPQRLLASGHAIAGSATDYAEGTLVLLSVQPGEDDCLRRLELGDFRHFAIANPKLAPYGAAARDWLERNGYWSALQDKLVVGESIGQAYHYVASGNAGLGLVAAAQLAATAPGRSGCRVVLPAGSHRPIVQQAVLLRGAKNPGIARHFIGFLQSDSALAIMRAHGYRCAGLNCAR